MQKKRDGTALTVGIAACLALGGVALLFVMIIAFALPVLLPGLFSGAGVEGGAFSWDWQPYHGRFGIMPMLAGTAALSALALAFACPLSLACVCWSLTRGRTARQGLCSGLALRAFHSLIRTMAAVPTVVYGFAAVFLLTPLVREGLGGSGMCLLSASLMLALLITPTMVMVLETGLGERLERVSPGGLALGMSRLDLLWHVVLPSARATLGAAVLLGFGRAAGDTLLPLMLAGNAPQAPHAVTDSVRALTAHMALVTSNEVGGAAYGSLFAAGALLLACNALVSLAARSLASRSPASRSQAGGRL